jgi:aryl-alcohol dehydrogenase-like predicted oxidoreductase
LEWISPVQNRRLGVTGLQVSCLGLGLAALGRPGYINLGHAHDLHLNYDPAAMETHAHEVLDAAWAAGIRYFDVARSYGKGEAFLASWLRRRKIDPNAVTVGSKWGYTYTAGWRVDAEKHEIKDHTLPVLLRQLAETRSILSDYLNIYHIHSATIESGVLDDSAVLDELARLKDTGVAVGLSVTGVRQPDIILKSLTLQRGGVRLFDVVQATWNLLERSAGPALMEAHAAGMGVIIKESLANGRLTARNSDPAFVEKSRLLYESAAAHGCSDDALALAAVLSQPWANVVLSGAAAVEQLRANLEAMRITVDDLPNVGESPQEYWHTRSQMAWN